MHIRMLGTGNAFAKKYDNNNALVSACTHNILIDCGMTAPRALHQMGMDFNQIRGVIVTHLHADHIGGLEEYAFKMKYKYRAKPAMYVTKELAEQLWNRSLRGGLENIDEGLNRLEHFFDLVFLEENKPSMIADGLKVELIRTQHVMSKLSYSLFLNDYLFYSSDILFDRALLEDIHSARRCSYILHDCELGNSRTVHCTLQELLTLPTEIQEKMWLYHYGDNMDQYIGRTGAMRFMLQRHNYHFPQVTS